jgi:hypothetical protein
MVRMGRVALDGTKLEANASKHKAMSYARLIDREQQVEAEIADLEATAAALLADAAAVDAAEDERFGASGKDADLPAELDRREKRLAKMQVARAQIEAEAAEKARKHAEGKERRRQDRRGEDYPDAVEAAGRDAADAARPKDKAQANFTDPASRIMKNSDGAYIQAYNAQAVVDDAHQIITAADITTNPADALNYTTMLDQSAANAGIHPRQALVDAGYCSEANLEAAAARKAEHGTDTFMATGGPRRAGPADSTRAHPQRRHLARTHGPQAADQARTRRLCPPQDHRRTRIRPDHYLPGRPWTAAARRGRSPRRMATARRLPQPPQDLPTRRNRRTGHRDRLTSWAARAPSRPRQAAQLTARTVITATQVSTGRPRPIPSTTATDRLLVTDPRS